MAARGPERRGFVLINALVLVLALSAVAVALLALSGRGTARLQATQSVQQATLYADAAEALVRTLLEQEWEDGGTDHLGETWATPDYAVPIGRGAVAVTLRDLDGRLNLNRISGAQDPALAELRRLLAVLGAPASVADAVAAFVARDAAPRAAAYLDRPVPIAPPGGPLASLEELRQAEGVSAALFDRIAPFVAVAPADAAAGAADGAVNVNTASAEVLVALIPALDVATARTIVAARAGAPFVSAVDFMTRAAELAGPDTFETADPARFTVRSDLFEAEIVVRLGAHEVRRRTLLMRDPGAAGQTRIVWRQAVPQ